MSVQPRLTSVDVFRGATMAAMVIVNNPGNWATVYAPLLHAEWHGWTPTDLIFPFFVFIVGVSITLSRRSQASLGVIFRRAALLYGLGLLLALYPRFNVATVRLVGVLPRLALCYLGAALIYRAVATREPSIQIRSALAWTAALLAGYWTLLTWVPVPGGVAGDLTPSGNLGAWLDRTLLTEAHLWRQSKTWDPEGLLSTLPAIGSALTGVAAGVALKSGRRSDVRAWLLGGGLVALVAGLVWDAWFPINKNLWTSSYVLFTSGLAALLLAGLHWAIDLRGYRRFTHPFVVLGVNALTLFLASGFLVKTMSLITVAGAEGTRISLSRWLYVTAFEPFAAPKTASLLFALANLAVLYALLHWMHRRRWWLRV
jgi:predicted acyltransferase